MPAAPDAPAADLSSIIKADAHARRLRDMARARLEKSLAEKLATERQLHRIDIDLRQLRARQGALEQEMAEARVGKTADSPGTSPPAMPAHLLSGVAQDSLLDTERALLRDRARALDALRQGSRQLQTQLADAEAVEGGLRGTLALLRERARATRTELERLQEEEGLRQRELDRSRATLTEIEARHAADQAAHDAIGRTVLEQRAAIARDGEALMTLEAQRVRLQADIGARSAELSGLDAERQTIAARIAQARSAASEDAELAAAVAAETAARDSLRQDLDRVRAEAANVADAINRDTAAKARLAGEAERLREELAAQQGAADVLRATLEATQSRGRDLRLAQARGAAVNAQDDATEAGPAAHVNHAAEASPARDALRKPADASRRLARMLAMALVFGLAAAGIYLVPSHWPSRTSTPPAASPAPLRAPQALAPIYPPDADAPLPLHYSRELGATGGTGAGESGVR